MIDQRNKRSVTIIVAVLVIVIVAVAALAQWRNYRTASRVDTALKAADAAEVAVGEAATIHGGLTQIKASELGYNPATSMNEYVASLAVGDGGRITITTKDTGATPAPQLLLIPGQANNNNGSINWNCSVVVGDLDDVPTRCRTKAAAATGTSLGVAKPTTSSAVSASSS